MAISETTERLTSLIDKIVVQLGKTHSFSPPSLRLKTPKERAHGDLTTSIALEMSPYLKMPSTEIAEMLKEKLSPFLLETPLKENIEKVEVKPPGFINFFLFKNVLYNVLAEIYKKGENFGRSNIGDGKTAQVEFVSANPTGPLSVGHGRGAALGDAIANLLEASGYRVTREYYFNDAGRQMQVLSESIYARYMEEIGKEYPFPEDGYQGEYIVNIAKELTAQHSDRLVSADLALFKERGKKTIFEGIKKTLEQLGVRFDNFYNENSLYESGKVAGVIDVLKKKDLAYEKDGALWFKAREFGLEQDRVIVRSTGEPTYRLPDMAYHKDKFERGFALMVDVFGADHVATYPDVLAGVEALGYDKEQVKIVIHQFVTLMKGNARVKMSTRKAEFVTLDELINEVGSDVTRFFFLMRKASSHLPFDIELAKKESPENPIYYIQYAHARICSIFKKIHSADSPLEKNCDFNLLKEDEAIDLMRTLKHFPQFVSRACERLEPHIIVQYLQELATQFHSFYTKYRVITDDLSLTHARLILIDAVRIVLASGLSLLGISIPEKM